MNMHIMYGLVFVASLIYLASLCSGKVINMDNDAKEKEWLNAAPFMRMLQLQEPPMEGKDVVILQNLLRRYEGLQHLSANGRYDFQTQKAVSIFQKDQLIPNNGILDPVTGSRVIEFLMHDGYRDNGVVPDDCKFKLHVPLHRDRNKETMATLYKCGNGGTVLHRFKIRTRGGTKDGHPLNQLTSNGDTPTGLSTVDLNSPEPKSLVKSYGPYPVLRLTKGLEGNVAIGRDNVTGIDGKDAFLNDYRIGILLHTGIWDDWDNTKPMPNSHGCMHCHPDDQKKLIDLLVNETEAVVNENPFGKKPYPYKSQGYISIEEID